MNVRESFLLGRLFARPFSDAERSVPLKSLAPSPKVFDLSDHEYGRRRAWIQLRSVYFGTRVRFPVPPPTTSAGKLSPASAALGVTARFVALLPHFLEDVTRCGEVCRPGPGSGRGGHSPHVISPLCSLTLQKFGTSACSSRSQEWGNGAGLRNRLPCRFRFRFGVGKHPGIEIGWGRPEVERRGMALAIMSRSIPKCWMLELTGATKEMSGGRSSAGCSD